MRNNNLLKDFSVSKTHFLVDFDRTLTRFFVNNKRSPSLIAVLRDEGYLGEYYSNKAQQLYNYYSNYENDPSLSLKERKAKMYEWWFKHYQLLKDVGFKREHIDQILKSKQIKLRDGVDTLLSKLDSLNIPVVIISASGLGKEPIKKILEKNGLDYDSIYIISNRLNWDENGNFIGAKEPLVHVANKDEAIVKKFPKIWLKIKNRKEVVLLGDSLEDVDMVKGFEYDKLIKIGLLNEKAEDLRGIYQEKYDFIIEGDGSLEPIIEMVDNM
jgi:5'-nucleotidase